MSIPYHGSQYSGKGGHYESWFLRANDPLAPLAFWIRYTLFIPADGRQPLGEIWAVWFDGKKDRVIAVKQEFHREQCFFDTTQLGVKLPVAELSGRMLRGEAEHHGHTIKWHLEHSGESAAIPFLPDNLYDAPFPKAKSVISRPQVVYRGYLDVDGEKIAVEGWPGSENHNWGSKHTDQYAWGQVTGFDNAPDVFFEAITARVKVGPIPTPWLTIAVLRQGEKTWLFNTIPRALKAKGRYDFFSWKLETGDKDTRLCASLSAPARHFTALTYFNPPSGSKTCLNSKIASCTLTLETGGKTYNFESQHGAAFEILTSRKDHGVPLSV